MTKNVFDFFRHKAINKCKETNTAKTSKKTKSNKIESKINQNNSEHQNSDNKNEEKTECNEIILHSWYGKLKTKFATSFETFGSSSGSCELNRIQEHSKKLVQVPLGENSLQNNSDEDGIAAPSNNDHRCDNVMQVGPVGHSTPTICDSYDNGTQYSRRDAYLLPELVLSSNLSLDKAAYGARMSPEAVQAGRASASPLLQVTCTHSDLFCLSPMCHNHGRIKPPTNDCNSNNDLDPLLPEHIYENISAENSQKKLIREYQDRHLQPNSRNLLHQSGSSPVLENECFSLTSCDLNGKDEAISPVDQNKASTSKSTESYLSNDMSSLDPDWKHVHSSPRLEFSVLHLTKASQIAQESDAIVSKQFKIFEDKPMKKKSKQQKHLNSPKHHLPETGKRSTTKNCSSPEISALSSTIMIGAPSDINDIDDAAALDAIPRVREDPIGGDSSESTMIAISKSWDNELKDIVKYGWYWGPITRHEADKKLSTLKDGTFLVRDSSNNNHLLTLSFRSHGKTFHSRIEYKNGMFSLYHNPECGGNFKSLRTLIEACVAHSTSGVSFYSKPGNGMPSFPLKLSSPLSRFTEVRSLQYLCRFTIRQYTRIDHINRLPLPSQIKGYLSEMHY